MNRFKETLQEINQRLVLPQPLKSRVMLEMSADLNDAYDYFIQQGKNPMQAQKMAEEKFTLTDQSIKELAMMHQSFFRKLADSTSQYRINILEKACVAIILFILAYLSVSVLLSENFKMFASIYNWPILGFTLSAISFFLYKSYVLYLKKDHQPLEIRRGLTVLLLFGGLSFFTSFMGYFIDLLYLADTPFIFLNNLMLVTISATDGISIEFLRQMANWFSQTMAMIMFGMLSTILSAVFWIILEHKVIKIEIAESQYLTSE
jgi:hypothetical protein